MDFVLLDQIAFVSLDRAVFSKVWVPDGTILFIRIRALPH